MCYIKLPLLSQLTDVDVPPIIQHYCRTQCYSIRAPETRIDPKHRPKEAGS
jgi:hypothetical protein